MSEILVSRGKLDIATELYALTQEMLNHKADEDFLILSVERRQDLMDEYDTLAAEDNSLTPEDKASLTGMFREMFDIDRLLTTSLEQLKTQSKTALVFSNNQQKILGYTNRAMSASGSYMDFKK